MSDDKYTEDLTVETELDAAAAPAADILPRFKACCL